MEYTCGCWGEDGREVIRKATSVCGCTSSSAAACVYCSCTVFIDSRGKLCTQVQQVSYLVCKDKQPLSSRCYQEFTRYLNFLAQVLLFVQFLDISTVPPVTKRPNSIIIASCWHTSCCVLRIYLGKGCHSFLRWNKTYWSPDSGFLQKENRQSARFPLAVQDEASKATHGVVIRLTDNRTSDRSLI